MLKPSPILQIRVFSRETATWSVLVKRILYLKMLRATRTFYVSIFVPLPFTWSMISRIYHFLPTKPLTQALNYLRRWKNVQQSLWSYGNHTWGIVAITAFHNDRWRVVSIWSHRLLNVFSSDRSNRSDHMETSLNGCHICLYVYTHSLRDVNLN